LRDSIAWKWLDYEFTLGPTEFSFNDSTTIRKLYGGYRFNERWAIEAFSSRTTVNGDLAGFPITADYDITGLRGLAHFNAVFIGIGYWDADISLSSIYTSAFPGDDSDISFLLGGEWSFDDHWGFRLDYELFDADGSNQSDLEALSFGVHYGFGRQ
jgi:hypothetical protein